MAPNEPPQDPLDGLGVDIPVLELGAAPTAENDFLQATDALTTAGVGMPGAGALLTSMREQLTSSWASTVVTN